MKDEKDRPRPASWIATSSLGIELAVVLGGSVWLGNKADRKYGTEPFGVLGGVLFGFIYGSYSFWKLLKMDEVKKKKEKDKSEAKPE